MEVLRLFMTQGLFGNAPAPSFMNSTHEAEPNALAPGSWNREADGPSQCKKEGVWEAGPFQIRENREVGVEANYIGLPPPSDIQHTVSIFYR